MAVNLATIHNQKVREFRVNGATERFDFDFIDAANRVVKELNMSAHDEPHIAAIGSTNVIIQISDDYYYVIGSGISYYLSISGQKPIDRGPDILDKFKSDWDDQLAFYIMDIVNTLQDDPTNDVIGLGAVGTNA